MLNVNNFKEWKENILIVLGCMDINLAVSTEQLIPLNDKISLRKIETLRMGTFKLFESNDHEAWDSRNI